MTRQSNARAGLLLLVLLATACEGLDPVGEYEGTVTQTSQTMTMLTDLAHDGTSTGNSNNANTSQSGVVVTIARVDERHLDVTLGDFCRVRFEQSPEPNEHHAQVVLVPEQRCPLALEGFTGELPVSGYLMLEPGQDPLPLSLNVSGNARRGDPDRAGFATATLSYSFHGRARPR